MFNVLLDHIVLCWVNGIKSPGDENSFTLRHGLRFHDKVGIVVRIAIMFKLLQLIWQMPSLWKESKIIREHLEHTIEILGQVVLPSYLVHAWEVVDLLEGLHLFPVRQGGCYVRPHNVPLNVGVPRVFATQLPVEVILGHFFDYIIHCVENV